jgi:hypothetical protein
MSDELPSKTLTVERRRVERRTMLVDNSAKGGSAAEYKPMYVVTERQGMTWLPITRGYEHSTSAYAKLGRITSRQSQKA